MKRIQALLRMHFGEMIFTQLIFQTGNAVCLLQQFLRRSVAQDTALMNDDGVVDEIFCLGDQMGGNQKRSAGGAVFFRQGFINISLQEAQHQTAPVPSVSPNVR